MTVDTGARAEQGTAIEAIKRSVRLTGRKRFLTPTMGSALGRGRPWTPHTIR